MSNMTTTRNGFRVQDITFKKARRQSEIDKEIENDTGVDRSNVSVPVSLTPEQVKSFYEQKIEATHNGQEKSLYRQTIRWIDEMLALKKRIVDYQLKEQKLSDGGIENTIE